MGKCQTQNVLEGGYCIGCGACAVVAPDTFGVILDDEGKKQAKLLRAPSDTAAELADAVCPFSAAAPNEDAHADTRFSSLPKDDATGYYGAIYAGHVAEGDFRQRGSSGGGVSWLINELFEKDMIDFVVHVGRGKNSTLFEYKLSRSAGEALEHTKSKYYPISLEAVVPQILDEPGRGLFVGVPCFVKTLRNLANANPALDDKVAFTAGLVCGHLKTAQFADNFGWQMGLAPGKLSEIDFRHMEDSHSGKANQYFVKATGTTPGGEVVTRTAQNHMLYGFLWGYGFFKYQACDYCDDIFAETADICFGDAWIPPYVENPLGDNILILRSQTLQSIIEEGVASGRLRLDPISVDAAKQSQDAGLRHRREGMAVRLAKRRSKGIWAPKKRFADTPAALRLSMRQRAIYTYRETMSTSSRSHYAKAVAQGIMSSSASRWTDTFDIITVFFT